MVIDTSAIAAILFQEPEAPRIAQCLASTSTRLWSSFTALECAIVVAARKGPGGVRCLDALVERAGIVTCPLNAEQVVLAREAWRRFGKGRHPAQLNIGDCCAYALAQQRREALLFKGQDFVRTDVAKAAY